MSLDFKTEDVIMCCLIRDITQFRRGGDEYKAVVE
jgi:hypothetical protein